MYFIEQHHILKEIISWQVGINLEALSIEDNGKGICFNVYCYNVQPLIEIDYATGESNLARTRIKI